MLQSTDETHPGPLHLPSLWLCIDCAISRRTKVQPGSRLFSEPLSIRHHRNIALHNWTKLKHGTIFFKYMWNGNLRWLSFPDSNRVYTPTKLSQHFLPPFWRLTSISDIHYKQHVGDPVLSFLCFMLCKWQSLLDADIALYATQGCFIIKTSYISIMVIMRKRTLEALKGSGWAAQMSTTQTRLSSQWNNIVINCYKLNSLSEFPQLGAGFT